MEIGLCELLVLRVRPMKTRILATDHALHHIFRAMDGVIVLLRTLPAIWDLACRFLHRHAG